MPMSCSTKKRLVLLNYSPSLQIRHHTAFRCLRRPSISTGTCSGPSAGRPAGCMLRLEQSLSYILSVIGFSPEKGHLFGSIHL